MFTLIEISIANELAKHGWEIADYRFQHVILATKKVRTFRGVGKIEIPKIIIDEEGMHYLKASFITKGENALSSCLSYIKNGDNIADLVKRFNCGVNRRICQAYSVKVGLSIEASNILDLIDFYGDALSQANHLVVNQATDPVKVMNEIRDFVA